MKKSELRKEIIEQIENVESCEIIKVYANGMGVGYDLYIELTLKNGKTQILEAKAHKYSWADVGHNAKNQNQFMKYTGSCDVYRNEVCEYWTHKSQSAFNEYFGRFKKDELIEFLAKITK